MSVYIITGEQGEGKGIMAMMQIQEALKLGKRVVTNIDLKLENLFPKELSQDVLRCSDFPDAEELWALGKGCENYNEKEFGLIVLDEMGLYLNARDFKDKGRGDFIKWLRHVRKMHWDLMMLVQSAESLDKQIRTGLAHFQVKCKAGDKMTVPFFSPIVKYFTGRALTLPKFHAGIVKRGFGAGAIKVDTWFTRGKEFWQAYDTGQIYNGEGEGLSAMLDPLKAGYMHRPTGIRESLYDAVHPYRQERPWLDGYLPAWLCTPSQARCRYLDFMVCERDGYPTKPVLQRPSFHEWEMGQISTAKVLADGVLRDVSEAKSAPVEVPQLQDLQVAA